MYLRHSAVYGEVIHNWPLILLSATWALDGVQGERLEVWCLSVIANIKCYTLG